MKHPERSSLLIFELVGADTPDKSAEKGCCYDYTGGH